MEGRPALSKGRLAGHERCESVGFDCYGTLTDWESRNISEFRPVYSIDVTDDEKLELHERAEHWLRSSWVTESYAKYRDVLEQKVWESGKRWRFAPELSMANALADSLKEWGLSPDAVEALWVIKKKYRLTIIFEITTGWTGFMCERFSRSDESFLHYFVAGCRARPQNPQPDDRSLHVQSLLSDWRLYS